MVAVMLSIHCFDYYHGVAKASGHNIIMHRHRQCLLVYTFLSICSGKADTGIESTTTTPENNMIYDDNPVNMNSEQQAAARSLAVSYYNYNKAVVASPRDNNKIIVWGESLRIAQKETGIELHYSRVIIRMIQKARKAQREEYRAEIT